MERYKKITYKTYFDISLIEIDLHENEIFEMEDFIIKISDFVELIGHKRPKYVLFNKRENDFEIDKEFHNFADKLVFDIIFSYHVNEILFLVNDRRYEKYKNITRQNIFAFKEMTDVFKHIEKRN